MLEPNVIPKTEPRLRVGLFLPEDGAKRVRMQLPNALDYFLLSNEGGKTPLTPGGLLEFAIETDGVIALTDGQTKGVSSRWRIMPAAEQLRPHVGITVNGVVAGRGFHWKKIIDATYSGVLEVSQNGQVLMVVNELLLEHYLACVATSEMGAACPTALIESQTIVARSWMLANIEMKHRKLGIDVCNDDCCQRYQGTTFLTEQSLRGALNTYGQVLLYGDRICDARYSKSCGGVSESFENVWDGQPVPYLEAIVDAPEGFQDSALPLDSEEKVRAWLEKVPAVYCSSHLLPEKELKKYLGNVDEEGTYFRWRFVYTQKEMTALLNLKLDLKAEAIQAILPVKRGKSGRLIEVRVVYYTQEGKREFVIKDQYTIRDCLHELFLYSSAFVVDTESDGGDVPAKFILKGGGWGHGVGYCQIGALSMALRGHTTAAILQHYYPGAQLIKIY